MAWGPPAVKTSATSAYLGFLALFGCGSAQHTPTEPECPLLIHIQDAHDSVTVVQPTTVNRIDAPFDQLACKQLMDVGGPECIQTRQVKTRQFLPQYFRL